MSTNQERVHALFSIVRYLAVEDRKAYLDKECVDDAELREEVESLLKYAPTSAPTRETGTIALGEKDVVDHRYEAGNRIGEYEIKSELGEGGFGIVYFAKQHEPVEREVAIKVLHSNRCTDTFILGFEAERQTLANMSHPGIAHFYDAGLTEHNQPFFVMEFVSGQPITEYCNEHRLSIKQRLALFADVCKAVQHAHTKGVIHRDLTPNNILVSTSEDGSPRAQIIDFGISRKTDEETADVMGTLMYMSPEQATKDASVDTRSDIYTLGVVLYELLVGKPPLDREMFKDAALQAQLKLVKEQDSPTPSTKLSGIGDSDETAAIAEQRQENLVSLLKILRRELDWIPRKALQKDPERRYATASEFGEDISRYLNDEVVVAVPDSARYRFNKTAKRHKGAFMSAAVVLVVLLAATVVSAVFWNQAIQERDIAKDATIRAKEEAQRAEKAEAGALQERDRANTEKDRATENEAKANQQKLIAEQEQQQTSEHKDIFRQFLLDLSFNKGKIDAESISRTLDKSVRTLEERHSLTPLHKAEIQIVFGITYFSLGKFTESEELLNDARDVVLNDPNGDQKLVILASEYLLPVSLGLGKDHTGKGHTFSPKANPDDVIRVLLQFIPYPEAKPYIIEITNALFDAYAKLDKEELQIFLAATESMNESFESIIGGGAEGMVSMMELMSRVTLLKESTQGKSSEDLQGLADQITSPFLQLVPLAEMFVPKIEFAELSPRSAELIASVLMGFDLYALAESVSRNWIETNRGSLESKSESAMDLGNSLGKSLYYQDKYTQAEAVFQEWLEISKESRGEDNQETISLGEWLGDTLKLQEKYSEAESVYREWLEISKESLGEKDEATMDLGRDLGWSLYDQKKYSKAEAVFREWLEISKNTLGEDNQKTISMGKWLGRSLYYQKNYTEAEAVFSELLDISKESRGEDNLETIRLADWLGATFDRQKKYSEAEAVYLEWLEISKESLGEKSDVAFDLGRDLGRSLYEQKKYTEAESVYREWLEISKESRGEDNLETIWLGKWLGRSLYEQKKYGEAETVFQEWLEISKNTLGEDNQKTISMGKWLGRSLYYQKNYTEAEAVFSELLDISKESRGEDNLETIRLADWLGATFDRQKKYSEAEAVYLEWLEISKESLGEKSDVAFDLGRDLGRSLYEQKKYTEAESVYREWLEISKESRGEDNLETIRLADWLGATFDRQKKYSEAESVYREWLEISKESLGEKSDVALDLGRDLGRSLYEQKKYTEAESVYREWLEISKESRGEDNLETIFLGIWIGKSLDAQKKYTEAEAVFKEWLEISKNALGEDNATTIDFANWMAYSLFMQENYVEAEEVYRKWLEIGNNALGENHSTTLSLADYYGRSLSKQEKYDDAGAVFTELVEISMNTLGEDDATTIGWASWMAYSLYMQENYVEAEEAYLKWLEISKNALGENHSKTLSLQNGLDRLKEKQKNTE